MSLMPKSIRWRIQIWYGLILFVVVAGFAGLLYYRISDSRFREIDADLHASALFLDVVLRRFPAHEMDSDESERIPPPPRFPPDRPPPGRPPPRAQLLAELQLPREAGRRPPDDPNRPSYFAVWRADGSLLKASNLPDEIKAAPLLSSSYPSYYHLSERGNERQFVMYGPRQSRILVGKDVRRERGDMRALAWQLTGVGLLVLTVGLAGGWVISARLLRPLAAISATASTLSATNLSGRIDTTQIDRELADLARILNATFARLETAFEQQTRFTADASHELRTPLAIIRTQVEYALARARTPEQYRETMQTCLRASSRMTHLIEELLALARADAGKLDLQQQPVDLQALVEESVALFEPLADINQIHFQCDLQPAEVTGDATRLGQVITNLLSNAIKYNRPGGSVTVTLTRDPQHVVLTVADTGIGIPEEDVPHIFERFYRVDKARSRTSGGNGLGLAICRSIIEAHGGTIRLTTQLNKGSTFWVHLSVQDSALHAQA